MKILIPDYLLKSILLHYRILANAYRYDGDTKAGNAKRVADKEIRKAEKIVNEQKTKTDLR